MLKITPYLEFDDEAQELHDRTCGAIVGLTYSESAVLAHLLQVQDAICDKEELIQVGWPDRVVAATSLTQCISTLRKKLEPYSELQLKTVARRGYQLHIASKSHVTMLAVSDAKSIKNALTDVSLMVKIAGIFIALVIICVCWYTSDHHKVIQQVGHWEGDKSISLNIGGHTEAFPLIYPNGEQSVHASMWQKHIAPETNFVENFSPYKGFAFTDGTHYSFATCQINEHDECSGETINLTNIDMAPAGLDMIEFMHISKVMEDRIRYNRILIPPADAASGELTEHHYHSDIYFPVVDELLIRADLGISLVYDKPLSGKFYSKACITDQDCLTTPIKYQIRGVFEQYRQKIGQLDVDVFHVKVKQKDLVMPEVVSDSAMHFYRELRKHSIRDEELYYYRVYADEGSAVWIVPLLGNLIAWSKYEKVEL